MQLEHRFPGLSLALLGALALAGPPAPEAGNTLTRPAPQLKAESAVTAGQGQARKMPASEARTGAATRRPVRQGTGPFDAEAKPGKHGHSAHKQPRRTLLHDVAALPPGAPDLGPDHTWVPAASFVDGLGWSHTRWDHRCRGLRVWGSQMITHRKGRTDLPATHSLALVMGPGGIPFAPPVLGGLTPSVSLERAQEAIRARLGPLARFPAFGAPEPVLYPVMEPFNLAVDGEVDAAAFPTLVTGYVLAYRIPARWETPGQKDADYLVDAHTGEILRELPLARNLGRPARGIGHTLYYGRVDLDTAERPELVPNLEDGKLEERYGRSGFELRDIGRGGGMVIDETYGRSGGHVFHNPKENVWGDGRAEDKDTPPESDTYRSTAASAAYAVQASWDYFLNVHGRRGPDGKGKGVNVHLHRRYDEPDNAAWQSDYIVIGSAVAYSPMVQLHVLGHEFTHGVIEFTAGLSAGDESEGLNEATADFFGQMIETWKLHGGGHSGSRPPSGLIGDAGTTWQVSFRKREPAGAGAVEVQRYLFEPAIKGELEQWSPELGSNIDPYIKGGPLGRALYFLSWGAAKAPGEEKTPAPRSSLPGDPHYSALLPEGMPGIGNDRTAAIWYRALSTELQSLSGYRDARRAALKAAKVLYGPREEWAVCDAFAAIAVGKPGRLVDPIETWIPRVETRVEAGAGLALSMTVPEDARVKSAAFLVDGVPQKVFTGPPFSLTLPDAGRRFSNGEHTFQVVIRDVEDQVECSPPRSFTLHNPVSQLLVDPTLENVIKWSKKGNTWKTNDLIMKQGPAGPRAVFDASLRTLEPYLRQEVTLPPAPVKLQLSFWLEAGGGAEAKGADSLRLKVFEALDGLGGPGELLLEAPFTAAGPSTGRVRHVYDLSPFAGKKVFICFFGKLAAGTGATFQLDTVALLAGPAGAPEWGEAKDPAPAGTPPVP